MENLVHPEDALFAAEKGFPAIAACEHFAGSRKLIEKALALQTDYGPIFDITADCEDGAPAGQEEAHASMVADMVGGELNRFGRIGVRIHDPSYPSWRKDVDIVLGQAGGKVAYITIPKAMSFHEARQVADYIQAQAGTLGLGRQIPLHILIETHGALRDVQTIAAIPNVEVLDFGLMDFDHLPGLRNRRRRRWDSTGRARRGAGAGPGSRLGRSTGGRRGTAGSCCGVRWLAGGGG